MAVSKKPLLENASVSKPIAKPASPQGKPLQNVRYERFAREVAKGNSFAAAYVKAGFQLNRTNACMLARKPDVRARIEKLKAKAAISLTIGVLCNARHERFAQEVAKGNSLSAAYVRAGYKQAGQNAWILARRPKVRARIEEIKGIVATRSGIKLERILEELARIGFANMLDYMSVGQGGDANLDLAGLTRDTAAAISQLVVDTHNARDGQDTVVVRRVRLKLADKRAALVDLGKHLGMFKERAERADDGAPNGVPAEPPDLSPLQIGRRIAFALERAKRDSAKS